MRCTCGAPRAGCDALRRIATRATPCSASLASATNWTTERPRRALPAMSWPGRWGSHARAFALVLLHGICPRTCGALHRNVAQCDALASISLAGVTIRPSRALRSESSYTTFRTLDPGSVPRALRSAPSAQSPAQVGITVLRYGRGAAVLARDRRLLNQLHGLHRRDSRHVAAYRERRRPHRVLF